MNRIKHLFFITLFSCSFFAVAQQKIVKTIKSDAPYVEVKTDGIDNLIIEESDTNELVMTIIDKNGLGVIENFSCDDFNCVLNIKTELKKNNLDINKVNFISIIPETNVSAVVKIPKNKKVTILGETIDIQTQGYQGILRILIDKGSVRIKAIKGITEVNLFTGTVFATINNNALDIRTRKGTITFNNEVQKSPYKKKKKKAHILVVKSISANVILTEQ
tara:strand:- start:71580 stop:72236 length:657 start_codon:yes stop_codon:yes gene_type:complete